MGRSAVCPEVYTVSHGNKLRLGLIVKHQLISLTHCRIGEGQSEIKMVRMLTNTNINHCLAFT